MHEKPVGESGLSQEELAFDMPDSRDLAVATADSVTADDAVQTATAIVADAKKRQETQAYSPDKPQPSESLDSYLQRLFDSGASITHSKPETAIGSINYLVRTAENVTIPTDQLEAAMQSFIVARGFPDVTISGKSEQGFFFEGISADGQREFRGRLTNLTRLPGAKYPTSKRWGDAIRVEVLNRGEKLA